MTLLNKTSHVIEFESATPFLRKLRITANKNGSINVFDSDGDDMTMVVICDLRQFISQLQELEREAKKHFGEDWGNL